MVDRLSQEDKMLLAMIIGELRENGPRDGEWIQSRLGAAGNMNVLDAVRAASGIKVPWLLHRILTHAVLREEKRERRRIEQLLELGLHSKHLRLVGSSLLYDCTAAGEDWAEDTYHANGQQQYDNDTTITLLAVDICEALNNGRALRTEQLKSVCAPRLHGLLKRDALHRKMQGGRSDAYERALTRALSLAEALGWIRHVGEAWDLTPQGRQTGLTYFDHAR